MTILLSLVLAAILIAVGRDFLKKHSHACYLAAVVLSVAVLILPQNLLPMGIRTWIWPILSKSGLATALFIIVMYTGALKNGSSLIRFLMPIRAELSIIACILTLGHNISYGKVYFRMLFTDADRLPANQLAAAECSLLLILLMLPLMITSFPSVRRKMEGRKWKRLQRSAYVFYGLLYVHVMLLSVPQAMQGNSTYFLNVLLYSVIFWVYAIMRVRKALLLKKSRTTAPHPVTRKAYAVRETEGACQAQNLQN